MADSPPDFTYDFFISRRGSVAALAQEAADSLTAEGHKVIVQDYDFAASGQFVQNIDDALRQSQNLLILYSHDYHASFWTRAEFHNFLAAVAVSDGKRRIGVLRCDDATPAGLMHSATFGDLHGVTDPGERRRIILAVAEGHTPATRPSPRIFGGAMPLENLLFTGRDDLLAALHATLSVEGGTAALTQAAVHGLGGVGKTSLARAYIARHGDDYAGVWWITAADRPGTLAGLTALAHALDPRLPATTPPEDAAQAALDAIAKRPEPFLLIYDNAPGPAALTGLLPKRGARVLITSRHPGWTRQARAWPVPEMPENEAAALLQRVADRQDDAGARRLARELGYLPLALDHAGAYARQTHISFDDYVSRVETLIGQAGDNPDYPASVEATFQIAITGLSATAHAVLGRFCWLAPDAIPLLLLDDSIGPEAERRDAVAALTNVSLVTVAPDTGAGPSVTMHRLVQAVMRNRLAATGAAEASRTESLTRLTSVFPYAFRDPGPWPLCRALLPHVRALEPRCASDENAVTLTSLLNLAGSFLQGSGDASGALPLYRRALESRERVLGAEHPATLTSVNNLAGCLRALGDASGALPLYRRALESRERVLGAEHPDTLTSVNNLAYCLETLGDASGALPLYRRALESRERVLGAEHPDTLISVNNLAYCLQALGDASSALPLYRRALECRERVLGAEHPDTLISVNNLAYCLWALGDASGALPLNRRALEGSERVLGAEHPATLTSVNNLAYCLQALGDASGALPLYRRALESRERVLGAEHPDTLTSAELWRKQLKPMIATRH
jgi:tetratricopeptide (TPR) repeat protein